MSAHKDVERCQAAQQIWFLGGVDAMPDANEGATFHLDVELLTGHDCQQLRGGGKSAGLPQELCHIGVHRESMREARRIGQPPLGITGEQTQNRTRGVRAVRFCVCSRY